MTKPFFMVYSSRGSGNCKHHSFGEAHKEATRFAEKNPKIEFIILQSLTGVICEHNPTFVDNLYGEAEDGMDQPEPLDF